jgi:hypothetical protein
VAVERVRRDVVRGARAREGVEERAAPADDERRARAGQQRREAQARRDGRARGFEGRGVERPRDVQTARPQRGDERVVRRARGRAGTG